jgi:hypothetical protein
MRPANRPGLVLEPIGESPGIARLGDHLRPEEPGEFSGDSRRDNGSAVLADGEAPEPAAEAELGSPGAGQNVGWQAFLAALKSGADAGWELVGPRRFGQEMSHLPVSGLGDPESALRSTGGLFAGDESDEAHELARGRKAAPVADLAGQGQGTQAVDTSIGSQAGDLFGEDSLLEVGNEVGFDGADPLLAVLDHGQ